MADRSQSQSYHDALGGGLLRAPEGRPQAHCSLPPRADAGAAAAWQQSGARTGDTEYAETQKELEKQLVFLLQQNNARQAQHGASAAALERSMRHRAAAPPPPTLPGERDADAHRQRPGHNIHPPSSGVHRAVVQNAASKRSGGSHRRSEQQQAQFQDDSNTQAFPYLPSSSAQCPMLQSSDAHGMFSLDALPPQVRI